LVRKQNKFRLLKTPMPCISRRKVEGYRLILVHGVCDPQVYPSGVGAKL
jgi:hypothetical protein